MPGQLFIYLIKGFDKHAVKEEIRGCESLVELYLMQAFCTGSLVKIRNDLNIYTRGIAYFKT